MAEDQNKQNTMTVIIPGENGDSGVLTPYETRLEQIREYVANKNIERDVIDQLMSIASDEHGVIAPKDKVAAIREIRAFILLAREEGLSLRMPQNLPSTVNFVVDKNLK